jgi:hypothetical protein
MGANARERGEIFRLPLKFARKQAKGAGTALDSIAFS